MSDIARDFIRENKEFIICEPSGKTYTELIKDNIQLFKLINDIPNETRKLDNSTLFE